MNNTLNSKIKIIKLNRDKLEKQISTCSFVDNLDREYILVEDLIEILNNLEIEIKSFPKNIYRFGLSIIKIFFVSAVCFMCALWMVLLCIKKI